ncbi:hypothetical protein [Catellatospora citrea]|uniref:hypothetical protein n=1 Tax=Catellatospora citrea TaxID=53366 RepID=UPI0014769470|nr:hypothetical protein [Catellatospora citrea]
MDIRYTRRHVLGQAAAPGSSPADRAAARAIMIVQIVLLTAASVVIALAVQ